MKFTILALALLAVSAGSVNSAAVVQPGALGVNLGVAMYNFYKAFVAIMPCGAPSMGIPVLAPFTVPEYNYNYESDYLKIHANLSDLYMTGINKAEILKFLYNDETNVFTYDIVYPQLQILGEYSSNLWANMAGYGVKINGLGLLNMKIVDYRSVGSFKIAPNENNVLEFSDDHINFYFGDIQINNWNEDWDVATNNYVNGAVRDYMMIWAQEVQPKFTPMWNDWYLSLINSGLEQVSESQFINTLQSMTEQFYSINCNAN